LKPHHPLLHCCRAITIIVVGEIELFALWQELGYYLRCVGRCSQLRQIAADEPWSPKLTRRRIPTWHVPPLFGKRGCAWLCIAQAMISPYDPEVRPVSCFRIPQHLLVRRKEITVTRCFIAMPPDLRPVRPQFSIQPMPRAQSAISAS
jgi:hypothetical protein